MQSSRLEKQKKGGVREEAAASMHAPHILTNAHFLYLQAACNASTSAHSYFSTSLRGGEADELSHLCYIILNMGTIRLDLDSINPGISRICDHSVPEFRLQAWK